MDYKVVEKAIDKLRESFKTDCMTETHFKCLKNIGDSLYFIKFQRFNELGLNLTLQIPSKFCSFFNSSSLFSLFL